MYLSSLKLLNFRNYSEQTIELTKGVNLFQGRNGHGKSNLLEAVYMLSIGKSIHSSQTVDYFNRELHKTGGYMMVAGVVQDIGRLFEVSVDKIVAAPERRLKSMGWFKVNGKKVKAGDFIGHVKVVLFEVNDVELTRKSPSTRRRYLDILIAQSDKEYLKALQRYTKLIKERNQLLRVFRGKASISETDREQLSYWNERTAEDGAIVVYKRLDAIKRLHEITQAIYTKISDGRSIELSYRVGTAEAKAVNVESIKASLKQGLQKMYRQDLKTQQTHIGPHRDDLLIKVDGYSAKSLSRGEMRLVTLALKLAEGDYITQVTGQKPIMALDDALSELDAEHREYVLGVLSQYEQVLLTTAEVSNDAHAKSVDATFWVKNGTVTNTISSPNR